MRLLWRPRREPQTGPPPRFVPDANEWLRSHLTDVPQQTVEFCGDLRGASMLNVGCGEMLADFGFLPRGVRRVVGLDVTHQEWKHLEDTAARVASAGYQVAPDWCGRLAYCRYNGREIPFRSASFDFVFSWSAFEHVGDVACVLAEIRRVVKPEGRVFIQVYPWFPSSLGSHLTDYIAEPFFHLRRPPERVRGQLERWVEAHPEDRKFVLSHMWQEYRTLNRYSAAQFLEAVRQAGFRVTRCRLISHDQDLTAVPENVRLVDAMVTGTMVLLRP